MRRFELHRDEDLSGVSGLGVVAEGVLFEDGSAALHWRGQWPTIVAWPAPDAVRAIEATHGHGGATRLVWVDGPDGVFAAARSGIAGDPL